MRIRSRDLEIHYDEKGAGTPVVWIHGFPLSSKLFDPQLEISGYRHIVPDLPGFGESPAVDRDFTIEDYAHAVLGVLDELHINSAWFAGVSMGGYICLAIARIASHRMRGLILIDTRENTDSDEARVGRYRSADSVAEKGVGVVVDAMLPKMFAESTAKENQQLVESTRRMMESSSRVGVVRALRAMATRVDSAATLRELDVPVLIIVGDSDSITPPAEAERMRSLAKSAELVTISGAAHLSNLEKPEEVNGAIEQFLARHGQPR